jgi:hypothetical protein
VLTTIIIGVIETSRTIEIQSYEEATRLLLIAFDNIQKYRQDHEQESVISSNPIDDEDLTQSIICQPWILYEQNLNDLFILHVNNKIFYSILNLNQIFVVYSTF